MEHWISKSASANGFPLSNTSMLANAVLCCSIKSANLFGFEGLIQLHCTYFCENLEYLIIWFALQIIQNVLIQILKLLCMKF